MMLNEQRPDKVPARDVARVHVQGGQWIRECLLSQEEYTKIKEYERFHPRNFKISKYEAPAILGMPLSHSVIFDELGVPFAVYRGKSLKAMVEKLVRRHGVTGEVALSERAEKICDDLRLNPDYEEDKVLGKGAFGRLKIAQNLRNGKWVAVKILKTRVGGKLRAADVLSDVAREKSILNRFGRLEGYAERGDESGTRYLFQDLIRGEELLTWLAKYPGERRVHRKQIIANVLDAVRASHDAYVLHRDLKLDNIMLHLETREVYLVDFGLSKEAESDLCTLDDKKVGTRLYIAPEVRLRAEGPYRYNEATEVYALGWVIGVLFFGKRFFDPFSAYTDKLLNAYGFHRQRHFLKRDAPCMTESSPSEEQEKFAQGGDMHNPMNFPLARLCIEIFHASYVQEMWTGATTPVCTLFSEIDVAAHKKTALLSDQKRPWAMLVGSMLSEESIRRPSLDQAYKQIQHLLSPLPHHSVSAPALVGVSPQIRLKK